MQKYAQNMQKYAKIYAEMCTNKDSISKNSDMQKYARNVQEICSYMQLNMQEYAEICTKHAKICKNICRNMYKYGQY